MDLASVPAAGPSTRVPCFVPHAASGVPRTYVCAGCTASCPPANPLSRKMRLSPPRAACHISTVQEPVAAVELCLLAF